MNLINQSFINNKFIFQGTEYSTHTFILYYVKYFVVTTNELLFGSFVSCDASTLLWLRKVTALSFAWRDSSKRQQCESLRVNYFSKRDYFLWLFQLVIIDSRNLIPAIEDTHKSIAYATIHALFNSLSNEKTWYM